MSPLLFKIYHWLMSVKRAVAAIAKKAYWWLWFNVWLRGNEFHPSLNLDVEAALKMTPQKRKAYYAELANKRSRAHQMDLDKMEKRTTQ